MNKNKQWVFISIGSVLAFGVMLAYIWGGFKSLPFRVSLFLLVGSMVVGAVVYYKEFSRSFRKGKMARGRLLESFALSIFFFAFFALLKTMDLSIDWTNKGLFRLSSETKEILKKIPKGSAFTITLFYYQDPNGNVDGVAEYGRKLAQRYESSHPNIIFKEVDPIRNKVVADEYGIQQNGTFVVEWQERREYIAPTLLVESFQEGEILYKGETIFSAAVEKLIDNKETTVYFLTGNGELDWTSGGARGYDGIYSTLKDRRYKLEALNLDHNIGVPKEANLLVIADPRSPLSEASLNSIERYIDQGGTILFMLSHNTSEDLNILLIRAGFVYLNNVAVDASRVAKNSGEFSIIPDLSPKSDITRLLRNNNLALVLPSSSAFAIIPQERSDTNYLYDIAPLARSTSQGWGETSFRAGKYQRGDDDIQGPLVLAASSIVASKKDPELQSRFVVFGSTEFLDNNSRFLAGNMRFFLNAVDFLLQKDLKTSVAPKTESLQFSIATPKQMRAMFIITLIALIGWLGVAIFVALVRRRMVKKS